MLDGLEEVALLLRSFVEENGVATLNVTGSRESKKAGIHARVSGVLEDALFWEENHSGLLEGVGGCLLSHSRSTRNTRVSERGPPPYLPSKNLD